MTALSEAKMLCSRNIRNEIHRFSKASANAPYRNSSHTFMGMKGNTVSYCRNCRQAERCIHPLPW